MTRTWFITGAARGLGADIARAAMAAGDRVVATGRDPAAVSTALGPDGDNLLSVGLDVSDAGQARAAVERALARLWRRRCAGQQCRLWAPRLPEENTMAEVEAQFATNLFGVFNVTAALPAMRAARAGRIFNISSLAGIRGSEFGSLYCASKFALEGFESLAPEVAPFGIFVTIVEPGPFRTDFPDTAVDALRRQGAAGLRRASGAAPGLVRAAQRQAAGRSAKVGASDAATGRRPEAADALHSGRHGRGRRRCQNSRGCKADLEQWRKLALGTDFPA